MIVFDSVTKLVSFLIKTFVASSDEVETPAEQPAETSGDENVDSVQPTEQPDTGA